MARGGGGKRRTYVRDANGRFASTPGGGGGLGAARKAARSQSGRASTLQARTSLKKSRAKLAGRDPADQRISATLGARAQKGAVTRGNRKLATAKGAAQTRLQGPARVGTIGKARPRKQPTSARPINQVPTRTPAAQRPGSMTSILGGTMRALAKADAQRIREIESITGQKVRPTAAGVKAGKKAGARVRATAKKGKVADALRAGLRELAQSDARTMRGMAQILRDATPKVAGGKARRAVAGGRKALPAGPAPSATQTAKKLARGPKTRLPRVATLSGVMRKSDFAKVRADAKKGIGTPLGRAMQRAIRRSAREAPLVRKKEIAAAKQRGATGFGGGPSMNTKSIGSSQFNWNRNEQPATIRERLAMWQKSERRMRGHWSGARATDGSYKGYLRASRRAAELVDIGSRLGNLPTTRKMAEEPRQRRLSRLDANRTQANLAWSDANRTLKPKIDKLQAKIKERIASGKKATDAQKNNLRDLTNQYNKSVRSRQVADAAKSYYESPWTYKPKKMSGNRVDQSLKTPKPPTRTKGSRTRLPGMAGVVGKPRGLKPGALAARRDGIPGLTGRKKQLTQAAKKRRLQADKIDAKVKALEKEYRSKDSAFYAQGAKPAGRDKMIAKMQKAVQLRDEAAALRLKADNAESMANRKKGTAAAIRQTRRDAFDAKGYKVGDTIVTSQNGVQRITKISKNSVRFDKGGPQDKAFMAMYLGL